MKRGSPSKLNHVSIAQVFEVGRVDGEYFWRSSLLMVAICARIHRRCRETGTRSLRSICVCFARDLAAVWPMRTVDKLPKDRRSRWCTVTSPPNVMVS